MKSTTFEHAMWVARYLEAKAKVITDEEMLKQVEAQYEALPEGIIRLLNFGLEYKKYLETCGSMEHMNGTYFNFVSGVICYGPSESRGTDTDDFRKHFREEKERYAKMCAGAI